MSAPPAKGKKNAKAPVEKSNGKASAVARSNAKAPVIKANKPKRTTNEDDPLVAVPDPKAQSEEIPGKTEIIAAEPESDQQMDAIDEEGSHHLLEGTQVKWSSKSQIEKEAVLQAHADKITATLQQLNITQVPKAKVGLALAADPFKKYNAASNQAPASFRVDEQARQIEKSPKEKEEGLITDVLRARAELDPYFRNFWRKVLRGPMSEDEEEEFMVYHREAKAQVARDTQDNKTETKETGETGSVPAIENQAVGEVKAQVASNTRDNKTKTKGTGETAIKNRAVGEANLFPSDLDDDISATLDRRGQEAFAIEPEDIAEGWEAVDKDDVPEDGDEQASDEMGVEKVSVEETRPKKKGWFSFLW